MSKAHSAHAELVQIERERCLKAVEDEHPKFRPLEQCERKFSENQAAMMVVHAVEKTKANIRARILEGAEK